VVIEDSKRAFDRRSCVMSTHRPNEADLSPNISPLSQLTPDEMEAIAEAEYQHVDYDLQPLRVQGLEHYLDRYDMSERFHIW
jgi:hypothetical protein